jgi:hypothetical protein
METSAPRWVKDPEILLVDDDDVLRESIAEGLEDVGYTVIRATDGNDALGHLRNSSLPSLVLLDLLMPGMNGWQLCEVMHADPALAGIPSSPSPRRRAWIPSPFTSRMWPTGWPSPSTSNRCWRSSALLRRARRHRHRRRLRPGPHPATGVTGPLLMPTVPVTPFGPTALLLASISKDSAACQGWPATCCE